MQIAAENTLQDEIIVQVFTEQSSKQLFFLINNREKIVTRGPRRPKLLNCVIRYVQLTLAASWTDHLFYLTLLVLTEVKMMAPTSAELWKWSRQPEYRFLRLDPSSKQEKLLAQEVKPSVLSTTFLYKSRAPVPGASPNNASLFLGMYQHLPHTLHSLYIFSSTVSSVGLQSVLLNI